MPTDYERFQAETRARSRQAALIRAICSEPGGMVKARWILDALEEPVNDEACEPVHPFLVEGSEVRFGTFTVKGNKTGGRPYDLCDCGLMLAHPVHATPPTPPEPKQPRERGASPE